MSADSKPANALAAHENITLRQHVVERWDRRIAIDEPRWFGTDLKAAFRESVAVDSPQTSNEAALHVPSGAVFVYEVLIGGWVVIRTVYHESAVEVSRIESGGEHGR